MNHRGYMQGKFKPNNPQKYIGDVTNIIYRSSWEMQFFRLLDLSETVTKWSSEGIAIRYYSPVHERMRRYFPDVLVEIQKGDLKKRYLIEIKPIQQVIPPKQTKNKKMQTYLNEMAEYTTNQAKWKAAQEWCVSHGIEFLLLTKDSASSSFKVLTEKEIPLG